MGHAFLFAGLLGLIALAFGKRCAAFAAALIVLAMLALVGAVIFDIASHGAISNRIPFGSDLSGNRHRR